MPAAVLAAVSSTAAAPRRAALVLLAGLVAVAGLLYAFWPAGVAVGTALGAVAVLAIGRTMTDSAAGDPVDEELVVRLGIQSPAPDAAATERARLRSDLGGDLPDFARAARLVVATQYASAARLQRELQVPWSRARRLLDDLEAEHLVGPASGTRPRPVLLAADRLPELERLLAGA